MGETVGSSVYATPSPRGFGHFSQQAYGISWDFTYSNPQNELEDMLGTCKVVEEEIKFMVFGLQSKDLNHTFVGFSRRNHNIERSLRCSAREFRPPYWKPTDMCRNCRTL